jgi:hypothetical protein
MFSIAAIIILLGTSATPPFLVSLIMFGGPLLWLSLMIDGIRETIKMASVRQPCWWVIYTLICGGLLVTSIYVPITSAGILSSTNTNFIFWMNATMSIVLMAGIKLSTAYQNKRRVLLLTTKTL